MYHLWKHISWGYFLLLMRPHPHTKYLLILMLAAWYNGGQLMAQPIGNFPGKNNMVTNNQHTDTPGDSIIFVGNMVCKTPGKFILTKSIPAQPLQLPLVRQPFLTVHGNVQYDFLYRSLVDTPFSQKDFRQHTVQATLDISIRNQYPFRVVLSSRRSNSPYFDNINDINFQFNKNIFIDRLKSTISKNLPSIPGREQLNEWENKYKKKKLEIQGLENWISDPARLQQITEAKEAAARRAMANADSNSISTTSIPDPKAAAQGLLKKVGDSLSTLADSLIAKKLNGKDSIYRKALAKYEEKKEALNKARNELKEYESKITTLKQSVQQADGKLKQQLAQVTDPAQLKEFIQSNKVDASSLPKGWKMLGAINSIGIGRSWVDYSELTVKNISLTGINAEANPGKFYVAFAAGKVNYRFRDFVVKNNQQPKQSLYLVRAGIGKKEGNNIIFTWYDGKKSPFSSYGAPTPTGTLERVMGMSVQTRLQVDANHYLILESAKSSFNNKPTGNPVATPLIDKVWNFKTRSNEAYSIKMYTYWPQSKTKLNGYYRKMGENFQSFNLQPINVNQEAYQFGLQQSFLKRKLTVDAGVRKNDFTSPAIYPGISSKTVFKSLQLTVRVPKYPFVSVGYFPSSQLTVLDNNIIAENQYNTLSAVVSHAYHVKNTSMSSNLVYLKFYNNSADTGFIYYNAESYTANQFLFLGKLQLQTGLTITRQRNLNVSTLEQSLSFEAKRWLVLSAGLKYNRLNSEQTLWGGTAGLGIVVKHIGTIQASYDKSYLPGTSKNLLPVDMGRIGFYRTF
jgi:hypothetical protein